jgi:chemotaxis protein methyltransferase CheR
LTKNGFDSFSSYFHFVLNDGSGEELSQMINILTTNFSYFMREWEHFTYFKETVLPEITRKTKKRDLRVWSAGCSTGQEPYTLAMLISDYFGERKDVWDAKVLATDISEKVLKTAEKGIYNSESLQKVPAAWKMDYFTKLNSDSWEVKDRMKKEVIFRRFNLMEEVFPFKKKLHVIFCRNVMIYFNEETKRVLINKFYDSLDNGGYLFIGQSESITRSETKFNYVKPSIYKKGE